MKSRILCTSAGTLLFSALLAHAATYTSDFSGLADGAPLVPTANGTGPGYNGWTQSEPNPDDSTPLAYGQPITGTGQGVAVGAYYETPTASFFFVDHTVGLPFAYSSLSSTFTMARTPFDAADANTQNRFEIGAYGAGGINLFSLVAEPSIDPDIWLIAYRTEGGATIQLSTTHAFAIDQITDMTANFTPSGADINFSLTLGTNGDSLNFTGTLPGLATQTFNSVRVSMDKVDGTDPSTDPYAAYGSNLIAVSDIAAVPEPSSIFLLSLIGCASLRRKRRN